MHTWPQNINVSTIDKIEMKKIEFKRREIIKGISSLTNEESPIGVIGGDKPEFIISDNITLYFTKFIGPFIQF